MAGIAAPRNRAAPFAVVMLMLAAVGLSPLPLLADTRESEAVSEQWVKAAYLYKFAAYVDWPAGVLDDPEAALTIGVIGDTSMTAALEEVTAGHTLRGRPIGIREVHRGDSLDGLQILFVARKEAEALPRLADEAQQRAILVVTESKHSFEPGSVINFRVVNRRVRFDVSVASAEKSRLTISSRLLAVAERVQPGPP